MCIPKEELENSRKDCVAIEKERIKKRLELVTEVDETIKSICKKVKSGESYPEDAEMIKALAALIQARAELS